jgi:hypothetical protein
MTILSPGETCTCPTDAPNGTFWYESGPDSRVAQCSRKDGTASFTVERPNNNVPAYMAIECDVGVLASTPSVAPCHITNRGTA